MSRHVVITGASTGIGRAAAEDLLQRGYCVYGSVRKQADADRLQAALGPNFMPLLFDVTDAAAVRAEAARLTDHLAGAGLAGLVNNAGVAISGPLQHVPLDEFRWQLEVNVTGALAVTQAFLPLLGAGFPQVHPPGRVINISSVSGRIVYPFFGPYAASKHALEAMSHALRRELRIYGIDVIIIGPGSVRTPIWDKAEEEGSSMYEATDYGPTYARLLQGAVKRGKRAQPVEVVNKAIRHALESPRPKTRYALPSRRLSGWLLPLWLPDRWLDRVMASNTGLKRRR